MSSTIPWGDYAPEQVETLVSAWLIRVVPRAQRVDGAGGDDGADVRAPVEGGLHIFEIKSFYRRLTSANKKQIVRSLETAVVRQSGMVRWTLVLPLDLTPAESRWFDQTLVPSTHFALDWIGRTELEAGLTEHRDLLRAFAPGSVERRAMDLLSEYSLAPATAGLAQTVPHRILVGEGDSETEAEFQAAYAAAGGAESLGRPRDTVTRLGPGYVQTLTGSERGGPSIICALPERAAVVVPMSMWQVLCRIGGGADRGAGVLAAGFPVRPSATQPSLVVDPSITSIDLDGGEWGPGRLVRVSPDEPWSWQPRPRFDFQLRHSTRWVSSEWTDLRLRAVADFPWVRSTVESEITKKSRRSLQSALMATEFAKVFPVLSMHRGARVPEPVWSQATGHDSYQSDRSTHLRALLTAPDGRTALSGEVLLYLPDNLYSTSVLGCVELRINFDAWRAVLSASGADLGDNANLRLSLIEVIEVLVSAWGTVTSVVPLAAVDDPRRMPLAGPPYVEMHVQANPPGSNGTRRCLGLADVIDLSLFGQPTRDGACQQTGMRFFAPLDMDRPARRILTAKGLAQLGRAWGYIDADADELLAADSGWSRGRVVG